jgi:hypothetical protein
MVNEKLRKKEDEDHAKWQADQLRQMEERDKQKREQEQRDRQATANLPEQQLQMILSGHRPRSSCCHLKQRAELFTHTKNCTALTGINIESGLWLLEVEYSRRKIIRLDETTHKKLMEFARPDEKYPDLINRLLDGYIAAAATPIASTNNNDRNK